LFSALSGKTAMGVLNNGETMKLYLIERIDPIGYDEYIGFVIAAESEAEAREMAAYLPGDEGAEIWKTAPIRCIADVTGETPGVVLYSFNAG
jgi:hypothetical protein